MDNGIMLSQILESDDPVSFILDNSSIDLSEDSAKDLLNKFARALTEVKRFQHDEFLDDWSLFVERSDDGGVEFSVQHNEIDLIGFLMDDDEYYEKEEVVENFGLDSLYIANYGEFLQNGDLKDRIVREFELWFDDSDLHENTIAHLKAVLHRGFRLPPFGEDRDTEVELTIDENEIFVGCIDENAMNDNPDYHLTHDAFDPTNITQSIDMGVQSWIGIDEEDDDWDDDMEEWEDEEEDYWDTEDELDDDWIPVDEEDD